MLSIRTSAQAKTFAHYLITYLCISLSIIFLLLPIYIIAYQNAQRIITQEQSQRVAEGFWGLQSALKDCQTYAYNMSSNTDINRIRLCHTNDKDIPKYLFNMFLFQQKNIWVNNVVQEVIIQFKNNDALLTRSSVYQDKQYFYKKFFNYGNLS
jgi:hypothetical protein